MPSVEYVHKSGESHQTHEQHASPVESNRRDLIRIGEKRPDEAPNRVDESDDVNGQASSAETPAAFGQRKIKDTTIRDTAWATSVSHYLRTFFWSVDLPIEMRYVPIIWKTVSILSFYDFWMNIQHLKRVTAPH
jgi:hypothetical protein